MEQINFFEEVPKKVYVKKVERILYEYPSLKAGIENEIALEHEGLGNLFPSMIASYEEAVRGSSISNPTEKFGIKRAEKEIKIRQIDRAMDVLSHEEKKLTEAKYFDRSQPSDVQVYMSHGISERDYYRIKDRTLRKIATALNII
jgi:ArpU family phage transcriptional regulator